MSHPPLLSCCQVVVVAVVMNGRGIRGGSLINVSQVEIRQQPRKRRSPFQGEEGLQSQPKRALQLTGRGPEPARRKMNRKRKRKKNKDSPYVVEPWVFIPYETTANQWPRGIKWSAVPLPCSTVFFSSYSNESRTTAPV